MTKVDETYPKPVRERQGCKVGWYTYDNQADADTAAKIAKKQAQRMLRQGFDFGYCMPGEIRRTEDGMFEVTTP